MLSRPLQHPGKVTQHSRTRIMRMLLTINLAIRLLRLLVNNVILNSNTLTLGTVSSAAPLFSPETHSSSSSSMTYHGPAAGGVVQSSNIAQLGQQNYATSGDTTHSPPSHHPSAAQIFFDNNNIHPQLRARTPLN